MPCRSEFYLYKRKKQKGSYWYVCYVDPVTFRQGTAKSIDVLKEKLGLWDFKSVKRRDEAAIIAKKALEMGIVGSGNCYHRTFEDYALEFWDFDRSMYIRRRNSMKPGSIGREYAANMYFFIKRDVLPLLPPGIRLSDIRTLHLDNVINALLVDRKLSSGTVQLVSLSFSIPLKEAYREGYIPSDPTERMVKVMRTERERGSLTFTECRKIYDYLESHKDSMVSSYRLGIKVALLTGMRSGEVRALNAADISSIDGMDEKMVAIRHSISPYSGLKSTKGKYERKVLIPSSLADELLANQDEEGRLLPSVFSGYVSSPTLREQFYKVLEAIGISREQRMERNLTFHSLRHSFSTLGREFNVSQEDRMLVMGHRSVEVNDRYTHPGLESLKRVSTISNMIAGTESADESAEA